MPTPVPSPAARDPLPVRLWMILQEPRVVTALTTLTWALLGLGGLLALIDTPATIAAKIGSPLTYTWGGFLLVAGVLGFLGAGLGWWWIERAAIAAGVAGSLIYAGIVVSLHVTQSGNRLPQTAFILVVAVSLIIRWERIRGAQVDPTRGMPRGTHND